MTGNHRLAQVADEIQRVIGQLLIAEVQDPRLAGVTITRVKMTSDLGLARVYFQVTGEARARAAAEAAFRKSAGFLRRELSRQLSLRAVPQLTFFYDDTQDEVARVEALFRKL